MRLATPEDPRRRWPFRMLLTTDPVRYASTRKTRPKMRIVAVVPATHLPPRVRPQVLALTDS